MEVPFLDLHAQYRSIQGPIDDAIAAVLASKAFIGGPFVERFEAQFSAWLGGATVIGCANGTDAIELALVALGVGRGDEVIVPAHSWISTAEAVSNVGASPVFVDTRPGEYLVDPARIEAAIGPKTRALIPVHLYGAAADMTAIGDIARRRGLFVIEDCAQAHGATHRGQKIGTFGDAATFSFYPGKNLGAYGDAGAVVCRDKAVATRVKMLTNHGQLTKHDHRIEGRNSRLDGLQAAILSAKLPHLDSWNDARKRAARLYDDKLARAGIAAPRVPEASTHVYHLYVVELDERERVKEELKAAGVETAVHYPRALTELPPYAALPSSSQTEVARRAASRILSLPMFPEITEAQIDHVVSSLERSVKRAPR